MRPRFRMGHLSREAVVVPREAGHLPREAGHLPRFPGQVGAFPGRAGDAPPRRTWRRGDMRWKGRAAQGETKVCMDAIVSLVGLPSETFACAHTIVSAVRRSETFACMDTIVSLAVVFSETLACTHAIVSPPPRPRRRCGAGRSAASAPSLATAATHPPCPVVAAASPCPSTTNPPGQGNMTCTRSSG